MSITMTMSDLRRGFAELCHRVIFGRERLIVTIEGDRVGLAPAADIEMLEEIEDKVDALAADAALKETETANAVSWEELKAELKL
jgi:hypothetical protein